MSLIMLTNNFLPVSGYRIGYIGYDGVMYDVGSFVCYWSSDPTFTHSGSLLNFNSGINGTLNGNGRSFGFAVRPVKE